MGFNLLSNPVTEASKSNVSPPVKSHPNPTLTTSSNIGIQLPGSKRKLV